MTAVGCVRIALPRAAQTDIRDIDLDADGRMLVLAGDRIHFGDEGVCALPPGIHFPLARWFGPETALVIDTRCRDGRENAVILHVDHGVTARFAVGDGVEDALRTENHIVVSYFDEGVFGGTQGRLGIAVCDLGGRLLWGWNDRVVASGAAEFIDDCYAIVKIGPDRIAALTYSEMELVTLDLATGQAERLMHGVRYAHALSERDGRYYLRDADGLSCGTRMLDGAAPAGKLRMRGLSNGRFLHFGSGEAWLETLA